jgi:hypothetical protein
LVRRRDGSLFHEWFEFRSGGELIGDLTAGLVIQVIFGLRPVPEPALQLR